MPGGGEGLADLYSWVSVGTKVIVLPMTDRRADLGRTIRLRLAVFEYETAPAFAGAVFAFTAGSYPASRSAILRAD